MRKSDSIGALAGALAKAQGQIRPADKDKINPHFRNTYATLASLWDAARGPLTANGLAFTQAVDGENLVSLLAHSSGEWIESIYPIKPVKQDPQGVGSAITYARRYSMQAMLGLSADDATEDDGTAASAHQTHTNAPQSTFVKKVTQPPNEAPKSKEGAFLNSSEFIPTAGKLKGRKLGERGLIELEQYAQELKTLEPGKLSAAAVTVLTQVEAEIAKRKTAITETESFEIFRG